MMRILSRPRQGGKTHATVEWVKGAPTHRAMVVSSQVRKAFLMEKYELTDDQIIVPLGSPAAITKRAVRIDDLEMLFDRVGLYYVDGFTCGPVEMI